MSNTPETTEITVEQYDAALTIAAEYERKKAEAEAAKRAAYAIPVEALVKSPEYLAVWTEVKRIVATESDDGFFGNSMAYFATVMPNLAAQVGITLVLPAPVEDTPIEPKPVEENEGE